MRKRLDGWLIVWALFLCSFWVRNLNADTVVYGFDDGTFQGWELLDNFGDPFPEDSPVTWEPSDAVQDIGDGFDLLAATSGDFRIVPSPWENRDCIGVGDCYTQILRSPEFFLDDSGAIEIDMMGGGAVSDRPFDELSDFPPDSADELTEFKTSECCQGFALRDATSGEYLLQAFSTGENDGKARPEDPAWRADWETVTISKEDLAPYANNNQPYQIDIYDSYSGGWGWIGFDTVRIPSSSNEEPRLQAGDSDQDLDFDQLDLVKVQVAAKYLTGQQATWGEGDWNAAPGGAVGAPPAGDGRFDQLDVIAALNNGLYLTGPYAAIPPGGQTGDGQTSIVYNPDTGEVSVDAPAGTNLTSVNMDSVSGMFSTHENAENLEGSFDTHSAGNLFKATFGSSFGSLSFGMVAQLGLAEDFVANDLAVVGSLEGGGGLGEVDLIYVPEPSACCLLIIGLLGFIPRSAPPCRNRTNISP